MQSLLLERATGAILPLAYATTITESLYASLAQSNRDYFPENCHSAAINALAIEEIESRYMLSGSGDSSIKLWDLADVPEGEEKYTPIASIPRKAAHNFGVSAVQWWKQDTGMFFTASFDHTVKVWDTNSLEVVHTFDLNNRVYAIDVNGAQINAHLSQALVAAASDQPFIRLLDIRASSSAHTLPGHKGKTIAVSWHPQNPYLLASGGHDGEAKVWDIRRSKSCLARLDMTKTNTRPASIDALNLGSTSIKAHLGPVNAVVWDRLGHILYTAGNDDKVRVWDMTSTTSPPVNKLINFGPLTRNKYLQTLPMILSPRTETETQYLLFSSDSGYILVFRAIDGKLVLRLLRSGSKNTVRATSLAYAGNFSAMYYSGCQDGDIVAWRGEGVKEELMQYGTVARDAPAEKNSNIEEEETAVKLTLEDLYDDPYFQMHHKNDPTLNPTDHSQE